MKLEELKRETLKEGKSVEELPNVYGFDTESELYSTYLKGLEYHKKNNPQLYQKIISGD